MIGANQSNPSAAILPGTDEAIQYQQEQLCGEYEMYTLARFLFLSLSSMVAGAGVGANAALFALFSSRAHCAERAAPATATLYARVLALLDACICAGYILLFGADAAVIYLRIRPLFALYHLYIVPAFVVARMAQLAIPYMLIFATLERLVWISNGKLRNPLLRRMYSVRGRQVTVAVTLGACAFLRLPTYWATTVHEYPQCTDFFRSKTAGPADWVMDSDFFYVYDFHLLSIAQTVLPFFLLLAINLIVVRRVSLLSSPRHSFSPAVLRLPPASPYSRSASVAISRRISGRNSNFTLSRRSSFMQRLVLNAPVRSAVYTMVCIVCSYLASNSLHLALTVLERSNSALLRDPEDPTLASTFHTVFSDVVSFVYMFTSAIRVLIYYACNPSVRAQIRAWLPCFRRARSSPPPPPPPLSAPPRKASAPLKVPAEELINGTVAALANGKIDHHPPIGFPAKHPYLLRSGYSTTSVSASATDDDDDDDDEEVIVL